MTGQNMNTVRHTLRKYFCITVFAVLCCLFFPGELTGFPALGRDDSYITPAVYAASENITLEEGEETGERTYGVENSHYQIYFNDEEDLLSPEEETKLLDIMIPITEYGNAAFMTTRIDSSYYEEATGDIYHDLFGSDSGTIFLIDMNNRQLIIFSDGDIYRTVTKRYANTITDNVYKMAKRGDYYGCAKEVYSEIYTLLSGSKIAQPMRHITNAMLALILSTMILYLITRRISGQRAAHSAEILAAIGATGHFANGRSTFSSRKKVYNPHTSDGGSGGGGSGGGGGGGGGGGSHGF